MGGYDLVCSPRQKKMRRFVLTTIRIAIGVGLVVYLALSGTIRWRAMAGLAANWPISLAALLVLLLDVVLLAWRLRLLLSPGGFHLPLGLSFRLTLIGIFFNSCLPGATGGDLIKIYYAMEGNQGRRTEVATVVLLDRAVGMFALLILPLLMIPLTPQSLVSKAAVKSLLFGALALAIIMFTGSLLCFSRRLRNSRVFSWCSQKLPGGRYAEGMFNTIHAYRRNVGVLAASVALSLFTHLLIIIVTLSAVWAIHPRTLAREMAVLIPLGHLANSLPLTPGGLGVGEAAFSSLFAMAGLSGGAEALLGWRLLNFLVGILGLLFYLQGHRRFVHDGETPVIESSVESACSRSTDRA